MQLTTKQGQEWIAEKLAATGGDGGHPFDSGCMPSGIAKVVIQCGAWFGPPLSRHYKWIVKRIYVHGPKVESENPRELPIYLGFPVHPDSSDRTLTFDLAVDDQIVKVVVWNGERVVTAVQFYTRRGLISPLYGFHGANDKETVFEGKTSDSHLAGVHGRFGGVIDKLGFTFVSPNKCFKGNALDDWSEMTVSSDKE